jgi:hypothetical protein
MTPIASICSRRGLKLVRVADGSEVTDYLTDYPGQMAAIEYITGPQTPHKLARPDSRVHRQGAPAGLLTSRFQVRVLGGSLE